MSWHFKVIPYLKERNEVFSNRNILKELPIHENPQFSTEDFFKSIQKRQNQIQVFFYLTFKRNFIYSSNDDPYIN